MSIELSESLVEAAQHQASIAGYSSLTDYISSLIRADQQRLAKAQFDQQLLIGLDSGEARPMSPENWQNVCQALRERQAQRQGCTM